MNSQNGNMNNIKKILNVEIAHQLMKQLRPHVTLENFLEIYHKANKADGYVIYGYFNSEENQQESLIGLLGARILYDYVHGRHLYIDDLVVHSNHRNQGVGKKLLEFAEMIAKSENCTGLRLCTGVDNQDGIRFYERENWKSRAIVFKKKFSS